VVGIGVFNPTGEGTGVGAVVMIVVTFGTGVVVGR
jgi:hypothetical protein